MCYICIIYLPVLYLLSVAVVVSLLIEDVVFNVSGLLLLLPLHV